MPVESWTAPEETPALAATAAAMIDAALVGSGLSHDAYWAAVRKGYNTPYNDPPRKRPAAAPIPVQIGLDGIDLPEIGLTETDALPVAAMAVRSAAEIHAG